MKDSELNTVRFWLNIVFRSSLAVELKQRILIEKAFFDNLKSPFHSIS